MAENAMQITVRHAKEALREIRQMNPGPYLNMSTAGISIRKLNELIEDFEDFSEDRHDED